LKNTKVKDRIQEYIKESKMQQIDEGEEQKLKEENEGDFNLLQGTVDKRKKELKV